MKAKKLLALFMASLFVVALLAGCGKKPGSGSNNSGDAGDGVEKITLKVWGPEEEMEITQQMCEAFDEAHPEYDCTFEIAVVGVDESAANLTTDPDLAADVCITPSGSLSQLVEAGLIYPITYDIDNIKTMYGEGALEACIRNGELYGLPSTPNTWFLYYNKNLFTEDEVKSLDTIMSKDLGEGIKNFSCAISNSWYIEAFFYAAGCTLYGEDGTDASDCTWNSAAGFEVGKYLIDLVNNEKYIEDLDGIGGSLFNEGKLGVLCTGTWSAPGIEEALGEDWAAAPLPTVTINGKESQMTNFADYKCFVVKSNTKHPLAAQQLAEWLNNEENQLLRYQVAGATPTCLSLLDNEELASDRATIALIAQTEYATPQPSISQINEYWNPVIAFGEGIVNGGITEANLQEMLDTMVDAITTKLVD